MNPTEGFKSESERDFPNIINVCVLKGACPCSCIHCPVGVVPQSERKKVFGEETIPFKLFQKIVDEAKDYKHSTLRIHSVGEPLLWKELINALKYAKKHEVKTWIFTSMVTSNNKLLEELAENASIIEVSVNSVEEKDYKKMKGIDSFQLVHDNLRHASEYIKNNKLKTRLIASRVETKDKDSDQEFLKYWKGTGLLSDCFIRSFHDYNGAIGEFEKEKRKPVPCLVHWARFNIDTSGKAIVCFNELFKRGGCDESLILGDINNEPIQTIWHSEKLNTIREAQLNGDYNIIRFTDKLPCLKCKYCSPLDTKRNTSEYQIKKLEEEKR